MSKLITLGIIALVAYAIWSTATGQGLGAFDVVLGFLASLMS